MLDRCLLAGLLLLASCTGADSPTQPDRPPAVASVEVTPATATLRRGQTLQLAATPKDAAGQALASRVVTWSSSADSVLTVTSTGLVSTKGLGSATVTAMSEGRSGLAAILVTPIPVAAVTVSPDTSSVMVGRTLQLMTTVTDSAGNTVSDRSVSWASSDTTRARVSTTGLVTPVAPGIVTIGASAEGKTGQARLTVLAVPVASVGVTAVWTTLTVGGSTQAQVTLSDEAGAVLTNRAVTWSTSSSSVATVTPSGLVTAVGPGSAVITATSEGRSGTLSITVLLRPQLATTNVLMDLSHEFTFEYDIFAQWAPYWNAGYRRTNSHANLASASVNLSAYDIAIILQERPLVAFGDDEMQRVQDWVHAGGRLVLIGLGSSTQSIAQLATRLGIAFSATRATKPYEVRQHPATVGVSQFDVTSYAAPATVLSASIPCDTLVADATKKPVAIACQAGAGKVVAISEPGFIANPYFQAIFNVQFTKQLMDWLGQRNRAEAVVPSRILPDLERPLSGGSKLRYTTRTATSGFVTLVEARHEAVDAELQRITGLQNVFATTFLALPCPAGGYSGGAEVGVCAYEEAGGMTLVLAHELMHSFDIPNPPPEMMHPVVSYVATKVGAALGGSAATAAAAEKLAWDEGFKRVDPTGRTLDVTNEVPFDRRGKMYWIIGRLEGTYPFSTTGLYDFPVAARDPANVLKRYYQRKRTEVGYTATPTNTVRLLSIAACRDLFPDFRAIGTTLGATPAGLAAEIVAACP